MNPLTKARRDLAAALVVPDGPTVHATVPEALTPPCLIVQAAENVLAPTDTYAHEYDVAMEVWLAVEYRSNEQATEDLEDLLLDVLPLVEATGWNLDRVHQPGPIRTAEWLAHGLRLAVSTTIDT